MSAFGTYLVLCVLLVVGLGVGAYLLNVPLVAIIVAAVVLLAVGVTAATTRARPREPRP